MVKYQFEINNLRFDQIPRNYWNQHLEVHFTQRMQEIKQRTCYWFFFFFCSSCLLTSILRNKLYQLKSSFLLMLSGLTYHLSFFPTNQNIKKLKYKNEQTKPHSFGCLFHILLLFLLNFIDIFIEIKIE